MNQGEPASDNRARALDLASVPGRMLSGGKLVEATDRAVYSVEDPSRGVHLAQIPDASEDDVDRMVIASHEASKKWGRLPVTERARYIREAAAALLVHAEELALLDSIDSGHPLQAMRGDVVLANELMLAYADWGMELRGDTIPATADHLHFTVREPYGVVARIVPYNHPLLFAAARAAGPLLAGNAIIVKAPDQAPLSALKLGEIFAEIFPPGVFSILSGQGRIAGSALVSHPLVRRIAFIGSPATGRSIQKTAAEAGVKNVTLELGGKNAMIVYPDADLEAAVAGAVGGMNFRWTSGQSCGSTSRLLLHESIAEEFTDRVVEEVKSISLGDPLDSSVEMGAMVSRGHHERVLSFIEAGSREGARLRTGGGRPELGGELEDGYFVEPTVFDRVEPGMTIETEEIFGPVLSVLKFKDQAEAISMSNDVQYGLTGSIWTKDLELAHGSARELEAGFIWINTSSHHFPGVPFGGMKESGIGREEGTEEVLEFTQTKSVNLKLGQAAV